MAKKSLLKYKRFMQNTKPTDKIDEEDRKEIREQGEKPSYYYDDAHGYKDYDKEKDGDEENDEFDD